jgi:hypothetical protein
MFGAGVSRTGNTSPVLTDFLPLRLRLESLENLAGADTPRNTCERTESDSYSTGRSAAKADPTGLRDELAVRYVQGYVGA